MKSKIKKCLKCKTYTLKDVCTICGEDTVNPLPPSFSPIDKYGKYRRELMREIR